MLIIHFVLLIHSCNYQLSFCFFVTTIPPFSVEMFFMFLMCGCFLSPQWQSRHRARLWFHGELGLAGDNQRGRGEVVLHFQPWKPWHILWGMATVIEWVCVCFQFVSFHFCVCVFTMDSVFFSSATVRAWSLCGGLSVSAARRPVWRDWEFIPPTPVSTTSGTFLSTFSYGTHRLDTVCTHQPISWPGTCVVARQPVETPGSYCGRQTNSSTHNFLL